MNGLEEAVRRAVDAEHELKGRVAAQEGTIKTLKHDIAIRDGRIEQLEIQLKLVEEDRDYHLRWSIEVTKAIFDIGIFVNEVINAARGKVGNDLQATVDPAKTEAILRGVEAEVMKRPAKPKSLPRDLDEAAE